MTRPTDLSDVLDLASPHALQQALATGVICAHHLSEHSLTAYSYARHPGETAHSSLYSFVFIQPGTHAWHAWCAGTVAVYQAPLQSCAAACCCFTPDALVVPLLGFIITPKHPVGERSRHGLVLVNSALPTARAGLLHIPGAITASQQLQLAADALQAHPEPPATCNHTLAYGPLPGLWQAAQQQLRLTFSKHPLPTAPGELAQAGSSAQPAACDDAAAGQPSEAQQQQQEAAANSAAPPAHPARPAADGRTFATCWAPDGVGPAAQQLLRKLRWVSLGPQFNWSSREYEGGRPHRPLPDQLQQLALVFAQAAQQVLELAGRQQEVQQMQEVHTSLPAAVEPAAGSSDGCAVQPEAGRQQQPTSRAWAAIIQATAVARRVIRQDLPAAPPVIATVIHDESTPALDSSDTEHTQHAGTKAQQPHRDAEHAASVTSTAEPLHPASNPCTFTAQHTPAPIHTIGLHTDPTGAGGITSGIRSSTFSSSSSSRPYHPDAALVNYYYEGDTLGGHRDDVEQDLAQPIVSISLGCPAVFLMGGASKAEEPSAVMVHSGDVLVLAGPARSCYHGGCWQAVGTLAPLRTGSLHGTCCMLPWSTARCT